MGSEEKSFTVFKCTTPVSVPIDTKGSNHIQITKEDEVKKVTTDDSLTSVDGKSFIRHVNVNMYAPDVGPKFYPVKGNVVTAPIITKNLPEAFSSLPISGRPESKDHLEQYLDQKIRDYVGGDLSEEDFTKLSKYCSPNHLKTGKELTMDPNVPSLGFLPFKKDDKECEEGKKLNIVKKFKLRVEKDKTNLFVKKLKYRGMRLLPLTTEDEDNTEKNGTPLEPGKDILYRVRFYRPFMGGKERNNSRHSVFTCDVVVSGQSRLSELRERIVCANDVDVRVDVSENPNNLPHATAKELFPSGFMFINNVFYVDEGEGRVDYTEPIRAWAERRGLGDFPKLDMQRVRLQDLVLRLGHPEVYVHQGNCEHLLTFSEVRLVSPREALRAPQLPRHTAVLQHQTVYCTTCAEFGAKWVVVGCQRVPFDPAFFCDTCFTLYLYIDGKKIGDFKAYSYRGNEINTLKPLG